ncbi:MAG: hypothetical protein K0Q99_1435 [Clostridia bacterium]|jgi:N-acetylglutamate synthase-like GNAT family acetyltransferase|nr:hypothetical protein [Clostridia bacterium]
MTEYQFIKDYKNINEYRLSFNSLANRTFGIDFETWYQQGFWNDDYICYSYIKDNEVISNASLSTMTLMINGKAQKAIQIGTVMTAPDYRRQGLAYQLMKRILADYDQAYELFFLAADDEAKALYQKCGFEPIDENQYIIDLASYQRIKEPLKPIEISPNKMLEVKRQSLPLSNTLSARGDEHVFMFYFTLGYREFIYQLQPDVFAVFEIDGEDLHLYDILSPKKVNQQEIIEQIIPKDVHRVFCHFTPDQLIKGLQVSLDTSGGWMIRTASNDIYPKLARFPKISQT